ncbi:hypothetical protein ACPPVU_23880 [Mucilaginibacter sp. McL0603]|uniref:hypothetical protein n=1 Tax=Mucilaginibacter sp. McL0603 TaxID=3415670 RepID=UPI003CEABEC6
MKKIIWLFIITFVCVTIVYAQDGWVSHKADNRISVKFPNEPKEVAAGTFIAHDKDSVGYAFTVIDFVAVAGIDSVALAPMKDTPEFAAQLKQGMGSSLPGVTLDDFTIGKWKGFSSYTTKGVNSAQKTKMYTFMVLIGNKLYSLSAIVPDGISTKGRDDFFASLTLTN